MLHYNVAMSRRQHIIFFVLAAVASLVMAIGSGPKIRPYIPLCWIVIGFVHYGIRLWLKWSTISERLVRNHGQELQRAGISVLRTSIGPFVNGLTLVEQRSVIAAFSRSAGRQIRRMHLYFHLTWIAFILVIVYAILVAGTWN